MQANTSDSTLLAELTLVSSAFVHLKIPFARHMFDCGILKHLNEGIIDIDDLHEFGS